MYYVNSNEDVIGNYIPNLTEYHSKENILLPNNTIDTSMATKMYKSHVFDKHRFIEGMIYEDQDILPKILYKKTSSIIRKIVFLCHPY